MTATVFDQTHGGLTDDVPYTAATALWTVIWTALIPQRGGSGICYSLMAANATASPTAAVTQFLNRCCDGQMCQRDEASVQ
jgi:hypothetical protein